MLTCDSKAFVFLILVQNMLTQALSLSAKSIDCLALSSFPGFP